MPPIEKMNSRIGVRNKTLIFYWFVFYLTLTVSLTLLKVGGLPVRVLMGSSLALFIFLFNHGHFVRAWNMSKDIILFVACFGLLGSVVSAANGLPLAELVQNISEVYVQTALNIILTMSVVSICGGKRVILSLIFVVACSSLLAVAQYLGIGASWSIRELLGNIQHEQFTVFFYTRRPMGVSLSPIILATQLCTAFAAYGIYRRLYADGKKFDFKVVISCFLFIIVCIACGNRSPILGALLFLSLYGIAGVPRFFIPATLIFASVALPISDIVFGALADAGSRVAEVEDASAAGRLTLIYYGVRLFLAQPWGYGLGFDPTIYWHDYWSEVIDMPNAEVIARYPLHNYILNMLNFYGFWVVLLLPTIFKYVFASRKVLIFFIPYALHIFFHNSGPLWNDTFIWIVISSGVAAVRSSKAAPLDGIELPAPALYAATARAQIPATR